MLEKSPLSLADDIGAVYLLPDKVLRAINDAKQAEVEALLRSGLIEALTRERLFPRTQVSLDSIPGHALVLEHELIAPATYPSEWSPEMLRRAGLCVLRVNEIAAHYGYELKDAHPHNVLFRALRPMLVDFGSLVPVDGRPGWRAESEFRQCYLRPLELYDAGLHWVFKRAFHGEGSGIPAAEHLLIRHPTLRVLGRSRLQKAAKYWRAYKNPRILTSQIISRELKYAWLRRLARFVGRNDRLPFRKTDFRGLARALEAFKLAPDTTWGDYHAELIASDGGIRLSPRLQRVVDLVASLRPNTVLDLAGNQGALARSMAQLPSVERTICADYDERAIDQLVANAHPEEQVCPVVCNLMGDSSPADTVSRQERLKSDVVIALAVTHHLILSQKYSIDSVLGALAGFSHAHVLVEFMPLGLHNGIGAPPIPDWYTLEWFEAALNRTFEVVHKEALEENRVLYVARLHDAD